MKKIIKCAAYSNVHRVADIELKEVSEILRKKDQVITIPLNRRELFITFYKILNDGGLTGLQGPGEKQSYMGLL